MLLRSALNARFEISGNDWTCETATQNYFKVLRTQFSSVKLYCPMSLWYFSDNHLSLAFARHFWHSNTIVCEKLNATIESFLWYQSQYHGTLTPVQAPFLTSSIFTCFIPRIQWIVPRSVWLVPFPTPICARISSVLLQTILQEYCWFYSQNSTVTYARPGALW